MCAIIELRNYVNKEEKIRQGHINRLNENLRNSLYGEAIEIDAKAIENGKLSSGQKFAIAVFNFKKEGQKIRVLFLRNYTGRASLNDQDLDELNGFGIKNDIDIGYLDYPGLEGVWLVNPAAVFAEAVSNDQFLKSIQFSVNQLLGLDSKDKVITMSKLARLYDETFSNASPALKNDMLEKLWQGCARRVMSEIKKIESKPGARPRSTPLKEKSRIVVVATAVNIDFTIKFNPMPGGNLAIESVSLNAGGSPTNIIRALNNMGVGCQIVGVYGAGVRGDIFRRLLKAEGIDTSQWVRIQNDSAFHLLAISQIADTEYRFIEPSPSLREDEMAELMCKLNTVCQGQKGGVLALSSRAPLGTPKEYLPSLIKIGKDNGMLVVYDPKKDVLVNKELCELILQAAPDILKPNLEEFSIITGEKEENLRKNRPRIVELARVLMGRYGIKCIVVSLDKDGALLAYKEKSYYAIGPDVKIESSVGAGDAATAAMINRYVENGYSLDDLSDEEALSLVKVFAAAGKETATKKGTDLADKAGIEQMEKRIRTGIGTDVEPAAAAQGAAEIEVYRIHDENLNYAPAIRDKTILCHVVTDSILPVQQRDILKTLEQDMRNEKYCEKVVSLSVKNLSDPKEFMKELEKVKAREEARYSGSKVQFDVACPSKDLVSNVQKLGMQALAFTKEGDGDIIQIEGIIMALRALQTGDMNRLLSVYRSLTGMDWTTEAQDIDKLAKELLFILPVRRVDVNAIGTLNRIIEDNVKAAA